MQHSYVKAPKHMHAIGTINIAEA